MNRLSSFLQESNHQLSCLPDKIVIVYRSGSFARQRGQINWMSTAHHLLKCTPYHYIYLKDDASMISKKKILLIFIPIVVQNMHALMTQSLYLNTYSRCFLERGKCLPNSVFGLLQFFLSIFFFTFSRGF